MLSEKKKFLLAQEPYLKIITVFSGETDYMEGFYRVFITRGSYNVEPSEYENYYNLILSEDFIGYILQYTKIMGGPDRFYAENIFDNRNERIREEVDDFLSKGNLGRVKYEVKKNKKDEWQELILELKAKNFEEFDKKVLEKAQELKKEYPFVSVPCETRTLYYIFDNQININA